MYLTLDLGNTSHKAGIFDGDDLIRLERYKRLDLPGMKDLLERFPEVHYGIAASVVPYPPGIKRFLRDRLRFFLRLDHGTPLPVVNRYLTPATLGNDRIACAVAASRIFPGLPVLVVNAGTCITYDFVNHRAEYLGGAIAPGLRMRLKAMHTLTSKLPFIELREPGGITGQDTEGSLLSGAVHGAAAEITGTVEEYRKRWPRLEVILSGGDMEYLDKLLKIPIFALPNIVMVGLNYILEYNLKHAE